MSIDPRELLALIPDADLLAEVQRRNLPTTDLIPVDASLVVGDLEIDQVGCVAYWRGSTARLTRRETEVLYALALARWQGIRVLSSKRLAMRIYRCADYSEIATVRTIVCTTRKKLPGLIATSPGATHGKGGYGLNLDAQEAAA